MANFSLGGGDERQPNLLSGGYGTIRTGGGTFATLSAGGFVKLTPYERLSRAGRTGAAGSNPYAAEITWDVELHTPRPGNPETEIGDGGRG